MRKQLMAVLAAAATAMGCGSPEVDIPAGNNQLTSDSGAGEELPPPSVSGVPARYPYARLALRGNATNAARIIIEGAGNPVSGNVQPIDGNFCVVVELAAAPAHYTLLVQSQASDGRLSAKTKVELERANDAPAPPDAKLCDGSPAQ